MHFVSPFISIYVHINIKSVKYRMTDVIIFTQKLFTRGTQNFQIQNWQKRWIKNNILHI